MDGPVRPSCVAALPRITAYGRSPSARARASGLSTIATTPSLRT
ncbi:hypothetical protein [Actinomadura luzonensis]|nr:hypothetical protein [Actinomadura luzonensis]